MIDYSEMKQIAMENVMVCDIFNHRWTVGPYSQCVECGRNGQVEDFNKGQIIMARWLHQSISKMARLVGCSKEAVVSNCCDLRGDKPQKLHHWSVRPTKSLNNSIWPKPTEGILWNKWQKILTTVMGGICPNTSKINQKSKCFWMFSLIFFSFICVIGNEILQKHLI